MGLKWAAHLGPPLCEPGHQMGPNWAAQLGSGLPSWEVDCPVGSHLCSNWAAQLGPIWACYLVPSLKTSILQMTLTYHRYKNVSVAQTSMDDDSSAVDIRNEIRVRVRLGPSQCQISQIRPGWQMLPCSPGCD